MKELDFQLKEIEKDLYESNISDLRQLSYLDNERERLIEEIEEKEIDILTHMEDMEKLKEEFFQIERDFKALKYEHAELIKRHKEIINELNKKEKEENKEIGILHSKLDKNILKKYIQLLNSRGNAVVEVIDNRCTGCNMLLPTFEIDRLKNYNEIIYCENCGRILFIRM